MKKKVTKTAHELGKVAKGLFCKVADDGRFPALGPEPAEKGAEVETGRVVVVVVEFKQVVAGGRYV